MAFNDLLLRELEGHGLTEDHLKQLLLVCKRGPGRATWHINAGGELTKVELTFFGTTSNSRGMRDLTRLLHKERA